MAARKQPERRHVRRRVADEQIATLRKRILSDERARRADHAVGIGMGGAVLGGAIGGPVGATIGGILGAVLGATEMGKRSTADR